MHSETDAEVRFTEQQRQKERGGIGDQFDDVVDLPEASSYGKKKFGWSDPVDEGPRPMVHSPLSRKEHYEQTVDELQSAAKRVVDPLCNFLDAQSNEYFPLRLLAGQCIELHVHFPGGFFNVVGRVSIVESTPALWVGHCRLGVNVLIRRESVGGAFVYDSREQE